MRSHIRAGGVKLDVYLAGNPHAKYEGVFLKWTSTSWGGVSANLNPLWKRAMDIYLAGTYSRSYCVQEWYDAVMEKMKWFVGRDERLPCIDMRLGEKEMDMYLAGRPHGAIRKNEMAQAIVMKTGIMDVHLAGTMDGNMSRFIDKHNEDGEMEIYLAGGSGERKSRVPEENQKGISILESFFYADDFTEKMLPFFGKFLLDSGAFTFFSGKNKNVKWEEYVDRYADFIVRNKVDRFFELDIDKLIGYDRIIALRNRLEKKTGKQAIPVWHKFRGKDNFIRMCDEYKYVAIGGIVSKEITPDEYRFLPWFIDHAHKKGAKIHGLGFTALSWLPKCHFDSVDSTAWTTGNRFGAVYKFNGTTMTKIGREENQRMKNTRELAVNNFNEWVKFQKYAENHL